MIPKSCNDNRNPSRLKRMLQFFTLERAHRLFYRFTERFAAAGLAVHFMLFLGMPFMMMEYVYMNILGGTSKPQVEDGNVLLQIPEQSWRGFFWMMNFYGALILVAIITWGLYILWDKGLTKQPMMKLAAKTILCAAVGTGLPLKLVYRYGMHIPSSYAPDLDYLGIFRITEIARSDYYSFEGFWFLSKFAVLPPVLLVITYMMQVALDNRSLQGRNASDAR